MENAAEIVKFDHHRVLAKLVHIRCTGEKNGEIQTGRQTSCFKMCFINRGYNLYLYNTVLALKAISMHNAHSFLCLAHYKLKEITICYYVQGHVEAIGNFQSSR